MRLATIPATLWPRPEPRSRIVLYAWYPPATGTDERTGPELPDGSRRDGDCSGPPVVGRSGLP